MKSNLDSLFKTDRESEKTGVWFLVKPEVGFLVKRFGGANAPEVQKKLALYYKPQARLIDKGQLDEETTRRIFLRVFVESSMIDWKGIEIDGEVKPFNSQLAVDFLMGLPELADALIEYAGDVANYKEDLGNS